jgi:hypothetical protein
VVLRGVGPAELEEITARLTSAWTDPTGRGVAVSLGTAAHQPGAAPEHTLAAADKALHATKSRRRVTPAPTAGHASGATAGDAEDGPTATQALAAMLGALQDDSP